MSLAFMGAALVPLSLYFYLAQGSDIKTEILTEYEYQYVDGPIQPLPKIKRIDKNWVILGQALFHSPLLSKDNSVACSNCHLITTGGDDGFAVSTGVGNRLGERNSPTVFNAVFNFRQFWDGRETTLARQIEGPVHNPVEMATSWPEVIAKLKADSYFSNEFKQLSADGVTQDNIVKALVTFEESLITPDSPIDRYLLGDKTALTSQQIRGLNKFINFGCTTCHQGKNIGGNFYQKLGRIDAVPARLKQDLGKYQVTGEEADKYVFKVPSLRNVADTSPYFHNGSVATLTEAVDIMASTQLGMDLSEQDNADIVALLQAFSAPVQELPSDQ